jgi:hypothetical protein
MADKGKNFMKTGVNLKTADRPGHSKQARDERSKKSKAAFKQNLNTLATMFGGKKKDDGKK